MKFTYWERNGNFNVCSLVSVIRLKRWCRTPRSWYRRGKLSWLALHLSIRNHR